MEKLLLRPDEAAELLSVGRSKLYALLASGDVPSIRVGRSVRVPAEALKLWVVSHTASVGPGNEESGEASR